MRSSSVGGLKPAGCFVDTLRAKPGENAGIALGRNERADVRRKKGMRTDAIVVYHDGRPRCWERLF
jgi:hypothetical protein